MLSGNSVRVWLGSSEVEKESFGEGCLRLFFVVKDVLTAIEEFVDLISRDTKVYVVNVRTTGRSSDVFCKPDKVTEIVIADLAKVGVEDSRIREQMKITGWKFVV